MVQQICPYLWWRYETVATQKFQEMKRRKRRMIVIRDSPNVSIWVSFAAKSLHPLGRLLVILRTGSKDISASVSIININPKSGSRKKRRVIKSWPVLSVSAWLGRFSFPIFDSFSKTKNRNRSGLGHRIFYESYFEFEFPVRRFRTITNISTLWARSRTFAVSIGTQVSQLFRNLW